jgi:tetratricopeptide (TPR) repeat protein
MVAEESVGTYERISARANFGLFDERDFFLGEFAFLAGGAFRLMGKRGEALDWLSRADYCFRHTINPAAGLANVSYARLALTFDTGEYAAVLQGAPALRESFLRLGMHTEVAKCSLLEAFALKQLGKSDTALARLAEAASLVESSNGPLLSRVLVEMADVYQLRNETSKAVTCFEKAASLLEPGEISLFSADLKMFLGAAYSGQEDFRNALEALKSAHHDYAALEMSTRAAYVNLFIANTLLRLGRTREAEWEILAALPVIEDQEMVAEGVAAVALLKESVRQRKADPAVISDVMKRLAARH